MSSQDAFGREPIDLHTDDPLFASIREFEQDRLVENHPLEDLIDKPKRLGFLMTHDEAIVARQPPIPPTHSLKRFPQNDKAPGIVGPYIIESVLGKGGFSTVFEARRSDMSGRFAVKVHRLGGLDSMKRLEIERSVLQILSHPNVISLVDFGNTQTGLHYVVMPLIDGLRIDRFVQNHQVPPRTIARIFAQVADGLQHVHDLGILHRDLKPGNILVTRSGFPVITDFGLAKQIRTETDESISTQSVTVTGAVLGTLGYIAPEQISSSSQEDTPSVDIYSLGATLFRVLTGETPKESRNLLKALKESRSKRPCFGVNSKKSAPKTLQIICLKCLENSPSDRYLSMEELRQDLQDYADGKIVNVRGYSSFQKLCRWTKKEPLAAILSFGLGCTLLLWAWSFHLILNLSGDFRNISNSSTTQSVPTVLGSNTQKPQTSEKKNDSHVDLGKKIDSLAKRN
jgi:serine/threonine protein kinase